MEHFSGQNNVVKICDFVLGKPSLANVLLEGAFNYFS